ncbi:MAG: cation:proton antiporter, partial [Thermodesulfobacteriota bacterium]
MTKVLSKCIFIIILAVPLVIYIPHIYSSIEEESYNTASTVHEQASLQDSSTAQTQKHSIKEKDNITHGHSDPIAPILLGIVIILAVAKIGGEIFEKIGQPAVLGELVLGIIIGNLAYLTGWEFFAPLRNHTFVDLLARFGVIILLFEIGLETNVRDLVKVGLSSFLVAMGGVMVPFILGYFTSLYF